MQPYLLLDFHLWFKNLTCANHREPTSILFRAVQSYQCTSRLSTSARWAVISKFRCTPFPFKTQGYTLALIWDFLHPLFAASLKYVTVLAIFCRLDKVLASFVCTVHYNCTALEKSSSTPSLSSQQCAKSAINDHPPASKDVFRAFFRVAFHTNTVPHI